MSPGARSPEELETLFEDAFVVRSRGALEELFGAGAVLAAAPGEVRGERIGQLAAALWDGDFSYLANPQRVVQARDTALVLSRQGINVARRQSDGRWLYSIALLDVNPTEGEARMTQAMAVETGQGEARWWLGALAEIKVTGEDTDGQLTIVEITEPPGGDAPLHVHHREDEGFWILEGEITLYVGDETIEVKAGDFAWGPRDIPHRYTAGPNGCRMLFLFAPAGLEGLVREMSVPAESRTVPPATDEEPDMEMVARVAERYGCELLQP